MMWHKCKWCGKSDVMWHKLKWCGIRDKYLFLLSYYNEGIGLPAYPQKSRILGHYPKICKSGIIFHFIAKKYLIRPLIHQCEAFLLENLSVGNVFTVLQYTIDCEADRKLKEKCAKIICAKTKDVLKSDEFLKISHKCLSFLLEQNSLSASEAELFNAVCLLHYRKRSCN